MTCDCIVIGGGPAGMMAAITAAKRGVRTVLLEHMDKPGKKILVTGNGHCNITNDNMGPEYFYSDDKEFVKRVLDAFGNKDTIEFFKSIGIKTRSKNGYVYPMSEQASCVRDNMENMLFYAGVTYRYGVAIESITEADMYTVRTKDEEYTASQLILATGLKASPKTGSTGSILPMYQGLGLRINKVLPALTYLTCDSGYCKSLAGVRATAEVGIRIDDVLCKSDVGEVQFTERGVSGIVVFQLSHIGVKALDNKQKVSVEFDFVKDMDEADIVEFFKEQKQMYPGLSLLNVAAGLVNKKLAAVILEEAGAPKGGLSLKKTDDELLERIAGVFKNFVMEVRGYGGYDSAQVCQGGVNVATVNPSTMECYEHKGLYVAGELLDVDGVCGGYNLQWAFSTGYIAGQSVAKMEEV